MHHLGKNRVSSPPSARRCGFDRRCRPARHAGFGQRTGGQADTDQTGTNVSFGPLKHINAGLLNIAYAEAGPADGPPVILLHGWPYDIHSFVDVTPMLASAGYRVLVRYLRGYGGTRFLLSETFRNAQPSAVAIGVIDFMNALRIEKALLAGFDWGADG